MKITFVSNFHNHHQMPLCDAFLAIPGVEFTFIATQKVPEDRIKFGYKHEFDHLSYYREAIGEADVAAAEQMCFDSDVVIIGSAPVSYVRRRLRARKLTFSYNERWFKQGFWRHPGDIYRAVRDFTLTGNRNFFQLCASAYTAPDSRRVLAFPGRCLRWGYFPEIKRYESIDNLLAEKKPASILWVGRLLDWKHPEAAIAVAKQLKAEGFDFTLNMIGNGELETKIQALIAKEDLGDRVCMLGAMSPEQVRIHMEQSQIFLFTSDSYEGWGAVLNEAMNSGCAVVASHAIGSVPYLIEHGKNGYIYSSGDNEELCEYVGRLLSERSISDRLGTNAYYTMTDKWNAQTAAKRLYALCAAKLAGTQCPRYLDGPVSFDPGKVKNHGKFK